MPIMRAMPDYRQLMIEGIEKWGFLTQQRAEIDAEILKLRQFLHGTMNMLSNTDKRIFQAQLANMEARSGGLVEAVREILKMATHTQTYFTAAEVRDNLIKAGFDFSEYRSNPLASVNTTIRRFKSSDVERKDVNGVAVYRWIFRFPREKTKKIPRR